MSARKSSSGSPRFPSNPRAATAPQFSNPPAPKHKHHGWRRLHAGVVEGKVEEQRRVVGRGERLLRRLADRLRPKLRGELEQAIIDTLLDHEAYLALLYMVIVSCGLQESIEKGGVSNRTRPGKDYPVPGIVDHNWSGNFKNADILLTFHSLNISLLT